MKKQVAASLILIIVIVASISVWSFIQANGQANYSLGLQQGKTAGYQEGWSEGNVTGHNEGYVQGLKDGAGTGYNIRDPSYQEMLNFITSDQTNKNTYNEDTYNCYDYTNDVCNNAFNAGIRCGNVWLDFPDSGHALVCFNTTDRGIIFIEPQSDAIVTLIIGQHYWDRALYQAPSYNDTIVNYGIVW